MGVMEMTDRLLMGLVAGLIVSIVPLSVLHIASVIAFSFVPTIEQLRIALAIVFIMVSTTTIIALFDDDIGKGGHID